MDKIKQLIKDLNVYPITPYEHPYIKKGYRYRDYLITSYTSGQDSTTNWYCRSLLPNGKPFTIKFESKSKNINVACKQIDKIKETL